MPNVKEKTKQAIGSVGNGIFGTFSVPSEELSRPKEKKFTKVKDTVAIHSSKNLYCPGLGKVLKGYNIIERKHAEAWLLKPGIRSATPEEVAKEYGL